MKARIPKHREFIINLAEDYEKKDECWDRDMGPVASPSM